MQRKVFLACLLVSAAACNDDEEPVRSKLDGSVVDSGTIDAGSLPSIDAGVAPAYVAATRIFGTGSEPPTTYVKVLSSIESGVRQDVATSQAFPGAAELFSLPTLGWFGIGGGEAPTLTRYTLGADGKLMAGASIDLSTRGLTDFFSDDLYFVSPTKVYLPDAAGRQLLIINPTEMKVDGVVALPQTAREGYTSVFSYASIARGDKLLFTVAWFDWKNDKLVDETALVVIDTKTDAVRVDVDKRCAGITQPVQTSSGDAYFISSALEGALFHLKRTPTEPCALRVLAGADAFDTSYHFKLSAASGGAIAGEPIPDTGDDVFLRVLDASKVTVKPETASYEVTGAAAWAWVRWNVKTNAVTPVAGIEPSASDAYFFDVGGRILVSQAKADFSSTQLVELNAAGGAKPVLSAEGFFSGIAKVR